MTDILKEVQNKITEFVKERNWGQYHSPKNLAMSVAIEAGELLEIFQWLTIEESYKVKDDPAKKEHVGEELSDVILYCLRMARVMEIDISHALLDKIEKNKKKYPADKYFGNYE
jgi:dCTP diphosphatase